MVVEFDKNRGSHFLKTKFMPSERKWGVHARASVGMVELVCFRSNITYNEVCILEGVIVYYSTLGSS